MKKTYVFAIIGSSRYGTEEIDAFETRKEAVKMLAEYRVAFGSGWSFRIKRVSE